MVKNGQNHRHRIAARKNISIASLSKIDHRRSLASRSCLDQTNLAKTMLQPERHRREGQCLPDVRRSIIPCFGIFSVFLVFLKSLVLCVVSTVLRVRCYLHLRWYYFKNSFSYNVMIKWNPVSTVQLYLVSIVQFFLEKENMLRN